MSSRLAAATSYKTMRSAAIAGKLVHFYARSGLFSGFLCGADDFHWKIVTPAGMTMLFHKANVDVAIDPDAVTIEDLEDETRAKIEPITRSFRDAMRKNEEES
jgi:hypothetical protein